MFVDEWYISCNVFMRQLFDDYLDRNPFWILRTDKIGCYFTRRLILPRCLILCMDFIRVGVDLRCILFMLNLVIDLDRSESV